MAKGGLGKGRQAPPVGGDVRPKKKASLFDDGEDDQTTTESIKINTEYAQRYQERKKKEELSNRKRSPTQPRPLQSATR